MKRIITLITVGLLASGYAYSQDPATPNPGFENWTLVGSRYDPDNWSNLNPSTAILGVYTCTRASGVDKHSGNYAIKLQTKSVFFQTANGVATTGTLITTAPYGVTGGIPYTGRPDSITGWFKYAPVGADSGLIQFSLFAAGDTVGYVRFQTGNYATSTYTRFSAPITYYSSATPDTALWLLSSSRAANPIVNSALYVDDLQLIYNCDKPTGLVTNSITSTSAKPKWSAVAGAEVYQVRYRVTGTPPWTNKTTTSLTKLITGLTPSTTYQWQVRAKCNVNPLVWSAWTTSQSFTTLAAKSTDLVLENSNSIVVYPNPVNDVLNLSVETSVDGNAVVRLSNTIGKIYIDKQLQIIDGMLNTSINVEDLPAGVYFLSIDTPEGRNTRKIIIN